MQKIVKKSSFDAGHRILGHQGKCKNFHGHLYSWEVELTFEGVDRIGYVIDFSLIEKWFVGYINKVMDHSAILNPKDDVFIEACEKASSLVYIMRLNGAEFCNPSAENMAKEMFLSFSWIKDIMGQTKFSISRVRLYETPTSYTDCFYESISDSEKKSFEAWRVNQIKDYCKTL